MENNTKIKVLPDGFVWRVLSTEEARAIWSTRAFEVYRLYDNGAEGLIEDDADFEDSLHRCTLGIEVGLFEVKPN